MQMLDISYNNFYGTIPSEIGKLSMLTFLNLEMNHLNGGVPLSIFNLSALQVLALGYNKISGSLPVSIGEGIPNIQGLHLGSNELYGNIPSSISNLSYISKLDLSFNSFNGLFPIALEGLKELQLLDLAENQFMNNISNPNQDFLSSLTSCSYLYTLEISYNPITGALPKSLGGTNLSASLETLLANSCNLIGQLPHEIGNLSKLISLGLGGNGLSGEIPTELGYLNSLIKLDLSTNQLSGQIPSTILQLQNLISLSLANNNLNGVIPDSFTSSDNLQHLDLAENNLSGPIPESLGALLHLNYFNVSYNNLSGEIPDREPYVKFPAGCFAGNEGLCGAPRFKVKVCKRSTPMKKNKIKKHIIVIAIIVPLILVACILILDIRICSGKLPPPSLPNLSQLPASKRISHEEILAATNNFHEDNLIGRGGISSVYKGMFSDAMIAAVKVFNLEIQGALKSFEVECQVLRTVRHRNLVEVVTFCSSLDFKAVLMAYMPNGSLERWLYSTDCSLNLEHRVGIMIDVASALEYLHQWHTFPIVHCNVKPSNILLDEDMVAHVGDFGIAKLLTAEQRMHLTTTLGTIGYMAPEYGSEGLVSSMVDVYSYGVLIMEILLRRKPTDVMFFGEFTMKRCVLESFPDSVMEIVDKDLVSVDDQSVRGGHERCLISCIELALDCTAELVEERPEMKDVAVRMRNIKSSLLAWI